MSNNRNIGKEILDGLRELKRGEHGRLETAPDVARAREKTGLSKPRKELRSPLASSFPRKRESSS